MSYIFLATVKTYNNPDTAKTIAYHALTAKDFTDAANIIESFYGNEMESMSLEMISDLSLLTIDECMCTRLRELNTF